VFVEDVGDGASSRLSSFLGSSESHSNSGANNAWTFTSVHHHRDRLASRRACTLVESYEGVLWLGLLLFFLKCYKYSRITSTRRVGVRIAFSFVLLGWPAVGSKVVVSS
jgi:hypothetical protein